MINWLGEKVIAVQRHTGATSDNEYPFPVGTHVRIKRMSWHHPCAGRTGVVTASYAPNAGRNVRVDDTGKITNCSRYELEETGDR